MSKYKIEVSKPDGSVTKEIVQAENAMAAIGESLLAVQPFNAVIVAAAGEVTMTVTNKENSEEVLTLHRR